MSDFFGACVIFWGVSECRGDCLAAVAAGLARRGGMAVGHCPTPQQLRGGLAVHVQMMLNYLAGAGGSKFCHGLVMLGWHLLGDEFAWMWMGDW